MCAPSPKRAPDQIRYGCRNNKHEEGVAQACTIGLSINENLKLKKRKGKDK